MGTNQIIIKNALKIAVGIVIYFFAMKLLGLENVVELRFLNFLFVIWGINSSIKSNIHENQNTAYVQNLFLGVSTAALAVLMTIGCLIIYVTFLSPQFIKVLEESFLWGNNLSLGLVVFALLIEGIASSVICSFILMQYWKNHKIKNLVT
jgi:hypothetical protein